jgi:hypothetical protein
MKQYQQITAALVAGFCVAALLCGCHRRKPDVPAQQCVNNLQMIEGEKKIWAVQSQKKAGDTPTDGDLFGVGHTFTARPKCPKGGVYTIGAIGQTPTCSVQGHLFDRHFD